jgi:excisionase family DNA binding protein
MKQKDSSPEKSGSEQASLGQTILLKLSAIEDLVKKKDEHAYRQTSKPLTFKEACAYLGYAPSYLYKLTYRNVIPHYNPTGKMIFFSKAELDEWIFKGSDERRMNSDELKTDKNTEKDPNQMEMGFDEKKGKKNEEINETEILIEFPLKSRRKK